MNRPNIEGYDQDFAQQYHNIDSELDLILILYEPLIGLLHDWDREGKVLDMATGTGRMPAILLRLNFDHVFGVDQSADMLNQAKFRLPRKLAQMQGERLAFRPDSFDYVTMANVLQDFGSREELITFLAEAIRVAKNKSQILIINPTPQNYLVTTKNFDGSRYPENKIAAKNGNGAAAKIYAEQMGQEYIDHIWTNADLRQIFKSFNLRVLAYKTPLATYQNPEYHWPTEMKIPPWAVYVLEVTKPADVQHQTVLKTLKERISRLFVAHS